MTRIPNDSNSIPANSGFETKFNRAVAWTASYTTRQVEKLSLESSDSLAAKAGKVFAALLSSIVLVPCALIAAFTCSVGDFLFGTIRDIPQENVTGAYISSCCSQTKRL